MSELKVSTLVSRMGAIMAALPATEKLISDRSDMTMQQFDIRICHPAGQAIPIWFGDDKNDAPTFFGSNMHFAHERRGISFDVLLMPKLTFDRLYAKDQERVEPPLAAAMTCRFKNANGKIVWVGLPMAFFSPNFRVALQHKGYWINAVIPDPIIVVYGGFQMLPHQGDYSIEEEA